ALAWLFLAKDGKGQSYLVIDNIEVNDDYSSIEPLKERIKKELINYTVGYAAAIGVKTVLAGMFGYSKVKMNEYPTRQLPLKKIGGYLNDDEYYLEALESDEVRVIKDINGAEVEL